MASKQEGQIEETSSDITQQQNATTTRRKCGIASENLLLVFTVLGVVAGIALGLILKSAIKGEPTLAPRAVYALEMPGTLFLRALKLLILPLITTSLINAIVNLDPQTAGKIGLFACLYYMFTTMTAVILGIILVSIIRPGKHGKSLEAPSGDSSNCEGTLPADTIMDLLRNMVPDNIVEAMFQSESSCVKYTSYINETKDTISRDAWEKLPGSDQSDFYADPFQVTKSGMNILGLVVFSLIFGVFISRMRGRAETLIKFIADLEAVTMKMIEAVIWLSPIGIMFLIAAAIVDMVDLWGQLAKLALYMATVITGLLIHALIVLPLMLFLLGKRNPFYYCYNLLQAYLTAFGTSSSSATMPVTLECLENKNGIKKEISRFVIPLGATINMDGTALYEAVAAIYISQSLPGEEMNIGKIIMVSLTATLASVGAAGIPQAGLVTMIMVLIAIGVDPRYFTLIVPVDWFLDRIRTTVNVHGDAIGAAVVQRFCGSQVDEHRHQVEQLQHHAGTEGGHEADHVGRAQAGAHDGGSVVGNGPAQMRRSGAGSDDGGIVVSNNNVPPTMLTIDYDEKKF